VLGRDAGDSPSQRYLAILDDEGTNWTKSWMFEVSFESLSPCASFGAVQGNADCIFASGPTIAYGPWTPLLADPLDLEAPAPSAP
jgi:hypothetical protein